MQDLKVALVQSELHWCNPGANLANLEELIWTLNEPVNLIVLPEMFTTGFAMEPEKYAEHPNGNTAKWMKQMAAQCKAMIAGSLMIKDGNQYFNRMMMVTPDGDVYTYDKRHLFKLAEEHHHFTAGSKRTPVEWNDWKLMPQICYDLRFPVFSRNDVGYHLLLYVANWPEPRISAWQKLLVARAIENQSYCIGLNRVGTDGKGHVYPGASTVVDPSGEVICTLDDQQQVQVVTLNKSVITAFRDKFPFLSDADRCQIEI